MENIRKLCTAAPGLLVGGAASKKGIPLYTNVQILVGLAGRKGFQLKTWNTGKPQKPDFTEK